MARRGHDGAGAGTRARARVLALAPVLVRVALLAALAAGLVAAVGGEDGFWMCLPLLLLAASGADGAFAGNGAFGVALRVLPVLIAALLAAGVEHGLGPPLWQALLVPSLCVLVARGLIGRLGRQRDLMERAALSDPLTGLANRRMLISRGRYEISRHRRAGSRFVVMMLDLDGFKAINDRYGHPAGDALLCDVADALHGVLRDQDTIARLGGDEFCVVAPETANPSALAEKIVGAVSRVTAGYQALSTSIGFAVFPQDGHELERLLRLADDRLIAAKRRRHARARRRAA